MTRYEKRLAAFKALGTAPDKTPWHELRKRLDENKLVLPKGPASAVQAPPSPKPTPKPKGKAAAAPSQSQVNAVSAAVAAALKAQPAAVRNGVAP